MGIGVARFSGSRLRAARGNAAVTWDQLADVIGVDRSVLVRWGAGGRRPAHHQLPILADALNVSPESLLDPMAPDPDLAQLRNETGLTQAEFATQIGAPRSTYAALEAGRSDVVLTDPLLCAIAEALHLTPDTIGAAHRASQRRARQATQTTITQRRHAQLQPRMTPELATGPVTEQYAHARARQFLAAAQVDAEITFDASVYQQRTARALDPRTAGELFRGPSDDRMPIPLLYFNLALAPDRQELDRILSHEVMHAGWPSYGHKEAAFTRAQRLLDTVDQPPRT